MYINHWKCPSGMFSSENSKHLLCQLNHLNPKNADIPYTQYDTSVSSPFHFFSRYSISGGIHIDSSLWGGADPISSISILSSSTSMTGIIVSYIFSVQSYRMYEWKFWLRINSTSLRIFPAFSCYLYNLWTPFFLLGPLIWCIPFLGGPCHWLFMYLPLIVEKNLLPLCKFSLPCWIPPIVFPPYPRLHRPLLLFRWWP